MRYWNNLHPVRSKLKYSKAKKSKALKKPKRLNRIANIFSYKISSTVESGRRLVVAEERKIYAKRK
jgi:hypothetical protein